MNKKAFYTLEFNKITDRLSDFAASPMAKKLAKKLKPSVDIDEIRELQRETSEAVDSIVKRGSLKLGGLCDIGEYIGYAAVGGTLPTEYLMKICDFLKLCKRAKSYGESESENVNLPILTPQFEFIEPVERLEREISRCIISETEIADDASVDLRNIRRNIKNANEKIKSQLNDIIHSQTYKKMLQESVITIRNDRYCVPVKSEYKSSFSGMLHDQSSTGATSFIEPAAVVELNNKIKDLIAEEKIEIARILKRLSEMVFEESDILKSNLEILTHLDFVFAKGELSVSMEGSEPKFNKKGYVNIKRGRHPLLEKEKVVPIDIFIGDKFSTLLITGPNTGGKTVSLKTMGLFTIMGQAGLHIPAFDNSELAVFDEVYADIGDEQSIEQSLSTFSSHMKNIVYILNHVTKNSLVLIDELGAGTDPTEGAALAVSIVSKLHSMNVRTAVTTHYSELKVFALTTDGVENAACEFDVNSLRPTYKLLIGIPGKSNAFAISKKLGLSDEIIDGAKEFLSHEDEKMEDIIADLEISKKSIIIEQERAESYRKEAEDLKKNAESNKAKTKEQKEKIILEAAEEAKRIIAEAKDEADAIVREVQKMARENASQSDMDKKRSQLKDKLNEADKKLSKLKKSKKVKHKSPENLQVGDRVYVHSFDTTGEVMSKPDAKGVVLVSIGMMDVRVNIKELSIDETQPEPEIKIKQPKKKYMGKSMSKAQNISAEVDLRGLMALEAIQKTDKYIDDAYLAGYSPITIIHGKGTGALKNAIHDFLRKDPRIKSFRLGEYGEGDAGVTVAELK